MMDLSQVKQMLSLKKKKNGMNTFHYNFTVHPGYFLADFLITILAVLDPVYLKLSGVILTLCLPTLNWLVAYPATPFTPLNFLVLSFMVLYFLPVYTFRMSFTPLMNFLVFLFKTIMLKTEPSFMLLGLAIILIFVCFTTFTDEDMSLQL